LKILVVSFVFPPEGGGVPEIAKTQAAGLAQRGHEVTVATDFDPARTPEHWPPKVTVRQFKVQGWRNARGGCQGETAAYEQFIAAYDGDIVLCNCWQNWATDLAVEVFPRIKARKVMVTQGFAAHAWQPYPRFAWGIGKWLREQPYVWRLPRMMKAFDHQILLSSRRDCGRFFDHWLARRLFPNRISIIPNGVHLEDLQNARMDFRQVYGIDSKYLVLDVANYCDRKNQLATLRDFMPLNNPEATLVFMGGEFNDYSDEMKRLYEANRTRYPSARVVFLEKVPREMINAAYRTADVFILSAKKETQPLAILDAMASGVPFISTNAGCVAEFPGGWVVPSGRRTTQAIHQLLDDANLRRTLGQAGRSACETKYDWNRIIDAYEGLFKSLLAS
jgi:glycosyltransferase involved in cell wall biosynthesis